MKRQPLLSTNYPYLLYFMRDDKAELVVDEANNKANIYYDNQKVEYERMNHFFIFMLKHFVPLALFIGIFDISIFQAINNWFVPIALFFAILPSFFIFKHKRHLMLFYFIALLLLAYYVVREHPYLVQDINYSFSIVTYLLFVVFIAYDVYVTYKHYEYYYIKDVATQVGYRTGQRKLSIGFWKLKKTFYFKKGSGKTLARINFLGTFVKVPDNIDWDRSEK